MTVPLTETERLTFGALLRTLLRLDGTITLEEQAVVHRVASDLLPRAEGEEIADAVAALLERSAERYPDDESVRAAARLINRQEARDALYGALYEISVAGTITTVESQLLDWLVEQWEVRIDDVETPAG